MAPKTYTTTPAHREWLRQFTRELQSRLKGMDLLSLRLSPRLTVTRAPYTDGWCSEAATLAVSGTSTIEAFVDTMATRKEPTLWVGLFVSGKDRVRSIARHVTKHHARVTIYTDRAFKVKNGQTYYAKPFSKKQFRRPTAEIFDHTYKDIGMYFPGGINWKTRPSRRIIAESSTFLAECVSALDAYSPPRQRSQSSFHNRQVWVTTKVFRRSSRQARDTLRRDGFKCQICLTIPERKYGFEGRACLDAHHIKALHRQKGKRTTTMRQLITVCANCHRVLGKLAPNRRGLAELRRRLT